MKLKLLLFALLSASTALAQTVQASADAANQADTNARPDSSSPVAFVYVARPTHVDAFAASSNGKLTVVPGSPFANIALTHLSTNKKFLFGPGSDKENIYSYSIASNGALKLVSKLNAKSYDNEEYCENFGPIALDATGTDLYNIINSDCETEVQSFKIESNGDLQYLGTLKTEITGDLFGVSNLTIPGDNKYAFQSVCGGDSFPGSGINEYKRESNGLLVNFANIELPDPENREDTYCAAYAMASDSSDHFAVVLSDVDDGFDSAGPDGIATYSVSSGGNATTKSTYENMPTDKVEDGSAISISPSGKLMAVGGFKGFQIYHYNGSSQATTYSGALQSGHGFIQFAWDSENHLYALSDDGKVYVYTVTTSSITEASGSPYSIPEASSLIVLSK